MHLGTYGFEVSSYRVNRDVLPLLYSGQVASVYSEQVGNLLLGKPAAFPRLGK